MSTVLALGLVIFLSLGFAFLFAFPVMWCWNAVIPSIFGLRAIGVLDAFCLSFLASTFFKSTGVSKE